MPGLIRSFKGLIRPRGVSLNASSISVEETKTYQLVATITPDGVKNNKLKWVSSNPSVATVDDTGLVTAISAGSTTITVTTDDRGFTDSCSCEIYVVPITSFQLNKSTTSITYGNTEQLSVTITPNDATYQGITWTSSNPSIATVDDNGLVTTVWEGNCTITATSNDGVHSASCDVTVNLIHVTGISLNKNSVNINAGEQEQLIATITPSNANIKTVTWSSSNTGVAVVDETGLVTYVADGNCTITVTTVDGGYTATCSVLCEDKKPVNQSFTYTGSDQSYTIPYTQCYKLEAWGAGSYDAAGGYASGVTCLTKGTVLRIMVGQSGSSGGTYGFGGVSNYSTSYNGGGLSGIFTDNSAITASDSSRALVIGGGAGSCSGRGCGGAGGGLCGCSGGNSGYGTQGGGGTQTGHGSTGNAGAYQFCGGSGSGRYGAGGGGGWWGGNGTAGDSSAWDDKGAGGGSGYVLSTMTSRTLTTGGGKAAQNHGCVKITSL